MKNYSKKELQSMSDWQLVQIYCDELGGIDENDLMIEVRGNKQERENLISHLLQRMKPKYAKGSTIKGESNFGKEGSGFDNPKYKDMYKGTYDNRGLALKPTNDITTLGSKLVIEYDKIYNRFYWKLMKQNGTEHSRGVNFKTRQEAIDDYMTTKFAKGSTVDGGDVGDTIADRYARLTKTEGKRLDELSKKVRINEQTDAEDVEWDKLVHKYRGWEYKHAKGGGIDINELNMPVIRTQFEDEEYEFKDGGRVDKDYMYSKFDFNKSGNFFATINNKNYEIIYRDDISQMYDLFENDKKIKSSKNLADLFYFPKKYSEGGTTKGFCYTIGGL